MHLNNDMENCLFAFDRLDNTIERMQTLFKPSEKFSFVQAQDGKETDVGFLRLVMIKSAFVQAEGEKKINEPINRLAEKACQNTNHSEGLRGIIYWNATNNIL